MYQIFSVFDVKKAVHVLSNCNLSYFPCIFLPIVDWSPVIRVSAINCADEKNMPVCRTYMIKGYPTVKVTRFLKQSQDDSLFLVFTHTYEVHDKFHIGLK